MVDRFIVDILDQRKGQCIRHWHPDQEFNCHKEFKDYKDAQTNWQVKITDDLVVQIGGIDHYASLFCCDVPKDEEISSLAPAVWALEGSATVFSVCSSYISSLSVI